MSDLPDSADISLLYHAMRILLYRPLLTVRNQPTGVTTSLEVCRGCAIDIHMILSLWGRTYGNINMVYLIMYTTFVAAGVDVILLRIGDSATREEALDRVHLSLSILEQAAGQGPGIRRGISIIASQLQAAMQRHFGVNGNNTVTNERSFAESSVRHNPTENGSTKHTSQAAGTALADPLAALAGPAFAADGSLVPGRPFSFESPALFDDPQALADLLGESNVHTDDPFAFLSGEAWEELRM